ncbi:MAG: selenocysteine-specific translation elongation factor [Vicinamibacteria bacterium]|nr:selenocysteine-specific translation elongation factor [Vicinamibacteria bacterium]
MRMRSFIVGTAGHIDHGKSSLVKALTGTDPDRLKEEKERGITIDLGFAHAPLSDDIVASFIDVPGHEKFVRNMLAGVSGIDAVLLVIAATEGVMPQTREHFHICRLLGIERGLIALTKVDAADPSMVDLAEQDARELVRGSFLEGSTVVRTSTRTGQGLDILKAALLDLAKRTRAREQTGLLRLPVDRVFTLKGFGTVITGTLTSGLVNVGEELVVLPSGKKARVRGLQVHGETVGIAVCGQRTAMNLAGVLVEDLSRGDLLVREGTLEPTRLAHVAIRLLEGCALKFDARVRVHAASAEVLGRVKFTAPELTKGGAAVAEIRFETPVVLGRGDRVVLRSYSPLATIGGGRVLDPHPRPRRRAEIAALQSAEEESDEAAVARFLREAGAAGLDLAALAGRMTLPASAARPLLASVRTAVPLHGAPDHFVDEGILAGLEEAALLRVKQHHEKDPLAKGLSKEELRRRVFGRARPGVFETALARMVGAGRVMETADLVALTSHRVRLSAPEDAARAAIEAALRAAGLEGVSLPNLHLQIGQDRKLCENAVRILVQEKQAERIGEGLLMARTALDAFRADARARFQSGAKLDVAEVKELTGLSRKYVIPLLEWLDRERVTRRVGAARIVL